MTRDYRETIILPASTDFQLQQKADYDYSAFLKENDSSDRLNSGFVLCAGPPYANGHTHVGHALSFCLKDIAARSHDSSFKPGWDCHGLPIEWAVEKKLMAEGKSKSDLSVIEFRKLCREFAQNWIDVQKAQFKEMGIAADWSNPYLTMDFSSEAKIVGVLQDLAKRDLLYLGTKPVMWSIVEETALADAEVEHKDIKTSNIWVRFPIYGAIDDCSIPIWTTTPWSIPANLAIAYNPEIAYGLYEVENVNEGSKCLMNEAFLLADTMAEEFAGVVGANLFRVSDADVAHICRELGHPRHPFTSEDDENKGWREESRWGEVLLIPSDHVKDNAGTGFVHIAPEHGPEDFVAWNKATNNYAFGNVVNDDGSYVENMPMFGGMKILQPTPKGEYIFEYANTKIIEELDRRGMLIHTKKEVHSYPHSWRSKAPLVYRTTPQWFINVNKIRQETLNEIDNISFIPEHGRTRFTAAIESRPDWLISRQRVWGTPLALIVNKETGEILKNAYVENRIKRSIAKEGGDIWWDYPVDVFLEGSGLNPDDYEKIMDTLDVWFDSGCVQFILGSKADVVIEGSDQARGWFGSSMILGMAVNGEPPFKKIITHGFVLADRGAKMSKSAGNGTSPEAIIKKYGADTLRLWAAMSDYTNDVVISDEVLKTSSEMLKKIRNTFKFLIGNLLNRSPYSRGGADNFPELEKYIISRVFETEAAVRKAYEEYNYAAVCRIVMEFCSRDLSAFYFDIRKDCLYCDPVESPTRQACIATLSLINFMLEDWVEPIIPFTVSEVQTYSNGGYWFKPSVKLLLGGAESKNNWTRILEILDMVNVAIEEARNRKEIRASLEAKVVLHISDPEVFDGIEPADIFRVSQVEIIKADTSSVVIVKAEGQKCARSWKVLPTVGSDPRYPDLSPRDAEAVAIYDAKK